MLKMRTHLKINAIEDTIDIIRLDLVTSSIKQCQFLVVDRKNLMNIIARFILWMQNYNLLLRFVFIINSKMIDFLIYLGNSKR